MHAKIHLEGMGLVGSLIACHFEHLGIDFTWSDVEAGASRPVNNFTAWRACTGQCYPSDQPDDLRGYAGVEQAIATIALVKKHSVSGMYGFATPRPPHYRRSENAVITRQLSPLKFLSLPSYHINAQTFVPDVRRRMASRLVVRPGTKQRVVIAHGFANLVPTRYFWGWSARAQVRISPKLRQLLGQRRLALNLKKPPYSFFYLYPLRGEGGQTGYYIGTHIICRANNQPADVGGKVMRVLEHANASCANLLEVALGPSAEIRHGWRPKPLGPGPAAFRHRQGYAVRPQHGSGFRHLGVWLPALLALLRQDGLCP